MKKMLQTTCFLCLLLTAMTTQAQMTFGFRGGLNLATYKFDYGSGTPPNAQLQPENIPLLTIGVSFQKVFNEYFALQAELNFIKKGFRFRNTSTSQATTFAFDIKQVINLLEIPILAKARFGSDVGIGGALFLGPSVSYGLSGGSTFISALTTSNVSTVTAGSEDLYFMKDDQSRVDFALNIGGEANYGGIFLDIRYQIGLTNMATSTKNVLSSTDISARPRGLGITAGYRFPIGGEEKSSKSRKK
jgi:Outer membrane protein beta-barrel domain